MNHGTTGSAPIEIASPLKRIMKRSHPVDVRVASDKHFLFQSDLIPIIADRHYHATTQVVGISGQKYSAYFTVVVLDANAKELSRRIQWLNDFSHNPKTYSVTLKAPPNARFAIVGYRVNMEGARRSPCEFRLEHPAKIKLNQVHDSKVTETPDWTIAPEVFEVEVYGVEFLFHDPPAQAGGSYYWRELLVGNVYEHSVVAYLAELKKRYESLRFVDAGAHYGFFTLYMSKMIGDSGNIYSFEPNWNYFQVLSRNVDTNHLTNVKLYQIALSDKKGKAMLETSRIFRRAGLTLEKRRMRALIPDESPKEGSVDTIPFDLLDEQEKIQPNIVKIDVHGAEGNIIHGMKDSLKHSVEHLFCELHDEMSDGYTAKSIVDMLQDADMEVFEFQGFREKNGEFIEIPSNLFDSPDNRMLYARKQVSKRI